MQTSLKTLMSLVRFWYRNYYFSVDNLCKDMYLRKHMDNDGYVSQQYRNGLANVILHLVNQSPKVNGSDPARHYLIIITRGPVLLELVLLGMMHVGINAVRVKCRSTSASERISAWLGMLYILMIPTLELGVRISLVSHIIMVMVLAIGVASPSSEAPASTLCATFPGGISRRIIAVSAS